MLVLVSECDNKTDQNSSEEPSIVMQEKKEVGFSVQIYCRAKHKSKDSLCSECQEFLIYVREKMHNCPYQDKKPICGVCQLSCFSPEKKQKGLKLFSYSGPRMLYKHPIVAIRHFWNALNQPPKPGA